MSASTHFGHLLPNWQAAKTQMRDILIECARQRRTITYGELAEQITLIHIPPNSYAMAGMLREISQEDQEAERGYLATLVVRKSDGRPGPGYFKGVEGNREDLEAFWQAQFVRVCDDWATPPQ